jgi:hypothetical protein
MCLVQGGGYERRRARHLRLVSGRLARRSAFTDLENRWEMVLDGPRARKEAAIVVGERVQRCCCTPGVRAALTKINLDLRLVVGCCSGASLAGRDSIFVSTRRRRHARRRPRSHPHQPALAQGQIVLRAGDTVPTARRVGPCRPHS